MLLHGGGCSISKLDTLPHRDVDFHLTNEVEVVIVESRLNRKANNRWYVGRCKLEKFLHGNVNFHCTNDVEV
jgi:hypothetical protein